MMALVLFDNSKLFRDIAQSKSISRGASAPLPEGAASRRLPEAAEDLRSVAGRSSRSGTGQLSGGDQGSGGDSVAGRGNGGGDGGIASAGAESRPAAGRSGWTGVYRLRRGSVDTARAGPLLPRPGHRDPPGHAVRQHSDDQGSGGTGVGDQHSTAAHDPVGGGA